MTVQTKCVGWKVCINWKPTWAFRHIPQAPRREVSCTKAECCLHCCIHLWPHRYPQQMAKDKELPFLVDNHSLQGAPEHLPCELLLFMHERRDPRTSILNMVLFSILTLYSRGQVFVSEFSSKLWGMKEKENTEKEQGWKRCPKDMEFDSLVLQRT